MIEAVAGAGRGEVLCGLCWTGDASSGLVSEGAAETEEGGGTEAEEETGRVHRSAEVTESS